MIQAVGCGLESGDLVRDVYETSAAASRRKIAAFLEAESYVMQNEFPSPNECGFVVSLTRF